MNICKKLNNLKKRNLAPIFTVSNYMLSLESDNNISDNEKYTNVEQYMDNSPKKFKNYILNPIHSSKISVAKTEANSKIIK